MRGEGSMALDLDQLLWVVEQAPPVMAADVVGQHLAAQFGASAVVLSVADLSGRALTRLSYDSMGDQDRAQGRERVVAPRAGVLEQPVDAARVVRDRRLGEVAGASIAPTTARARPR